MPPGVLINANFDILHLYGSPGEFLNIADGKPVFDLLHMIRGEFGADLQTLTYQAQHKKVSAYGRARTLKLESGKRALYVDRLKQAIAKAGRSKAQVAVMFVDVDNFKIINDSMGHNVGDLLLRQVTGRLSECVRAGDTVARFGGDEFTILLENTRPAEVSATAERIITQLSMPHILEERKVYTTASIGICVYPQDGTDTQTLLKSADVAMYRAKDSGKNNFQFFTEELKMLTSERLFYASDLRQAMERGQLYLVYQPQIDMQTGLAVGLEALLRWRHPERGLVPPDRFIPMAEETGLIEVVGDWVLESVCQQIGAWKSVGLEPPRISVNISSRQLRKVHFPEKIACLLSKFGLEPKCLALEFTEHALLENVDYVLAMITLDATHPAGYDLLSENPPISPMPTSKRVSLSRPQGRRQAPARKQGDGVPARNLLRKNC